MKVVSLKVSDALAAKLASVARKRRTTKSNLIREALEEFLDGKGMTNRGSFLDGIEDLVGCLDSGQADLGHNEKHMEGYGR